MYEIVDDYGTHKTCWRWKTALEWLACCSPKAIITHHLTGALLAHRVVTCGRSPL